MSDAVHASPQYRVRLADSTDTDALVQLINAAFAVEKIVIEGDRIDSEKVRALFGSGNFLLLFEAEELLGCVYVEVKGKRTAWSAAEPAEIRIGPPAHHGCRRLFPQRRM